MFERVHLELAACTCARFWGVSPAQEMGCRGGTAPGEGEMSQHCLTVDGRRGIVLRRCEVLVLRYCAAY